MVAPFVSIILALCSGLVLAFLLLRLLIRTQDQLPDLPRGNLGWPLLGETIGFLKPHKSNSLGGFLQEHCSRYGRIFRSHLFGSPTIVSCDHEFNMFILQNEGKLFQASYPKPMQDILGKHSFLTVSGDFHKKLRTFALNFISTSKSSPDFFGFVEHHAISMMDSWRSCKEVPFYKEVKEFTLKTMLKQLLNVTPEDPISSVILEDFETFMKGFVSLPLNIPGSAYAKAVKARARLSSTVSAIMTEREQRNVGVIEGGDFFAAMMSNGGLSFEEKLSIILDLLLGGYETTATLLSLIVYFLGHAPNALETLKEEHQRIRKSKENGEPLTWADYKKMQFTYNVACEAMRCGNVVKFVHRKAIQDVKYKEFLIPSGWKVFPVLMAPNFDPTLHENPSEFNPWRWFVETTSKKVAPFGGGPRLCPGAELAKVEVAFFLHHLVLNYRWKTKADDYPLAHPYVLFRRGLLLEIEPIR